MTAPTGAGPAAGERDWPVAVAPRDCAPPGAWLHALQALLLRRLTRTREHHAVPLERLSVPGAVVRPAPIAGPNGRQLAGWLVTPLSTGDSISRRPAALLLHGWGSNASAMWPMVEPLAAAGLIVLLIDARGHGASDDDGFSSLPRFAEDAGTALNWLSRQAGVETSALAVIGHSVGGAAALLQGARGPGPVPRAVVSLSAFAHPREVMMRWASARGWPWSALAGALAARVECLIGERFDAIAPIHQVRRIKGDLLVAHGLDDATVPFDDALRLWHARPGAELLPLTADHDLRGATQELAPELLRFLNRTLRCPAP